MKGQKSGVRILFILNCQYCTYVHLEVVLYNPAIEYCVLIDFKLAADAATAPSDVFEFNL